MPRTITFPAIPPTWNANRSSVAVYAIDDQVVVNCLIPLETLISHYGARSMGGEECVRAFVENRRTIEEAVRQKLLKGPASTSGDEVLLLPTDSVLRSSTTTTSTTTTTTPPPPSSKLTVRIEAGDVADEQLTNAIGQANWLIESELSRGRTAVHADWALFRGSNNLNLARLTLADGTGVSSQGVYTQADLENRSFLRFSLFRLWDDILREKVVRQMSAIETAEKAGVP